MDSMECKISFDKPNSPYVPEEKITGQVIIDGDTFSDEVESVTLTLSGKCLAQKPKGKIYYDAYAPDMIEEFKTVICDEKIMFSVKKELTEINKLAGKRVAYPFDHDLMPDLPTTIDIYYGGTRGTIQYKAEVEIDFKYNYNDPPKKFTKEFTVCSIVDLNDMPLDVSENFIYEEVKEYCKFGTNMAPVHVKFLLPKKGYTPEEIMQITLVIDNKCAFEMEIGLEFKVRVILNIKGEINYINKTVNTIFSGVKIEPNNVTIINTHYKVPSLPASYSNPSISSIGILYVFEVRAASSPSNLLTAVILKNWNVLRFTSTEIYIGTLPIENEFLSEDTASTTVELESVEIAKEAVQNLLRTSL